MSNRTRLDRMASLALAVALAGLWAHVPSSARAEHHAGASTKPHASAQDDPFPRLLAIVFVRSGPPVPTLIDRIASWFPPDTEVLLSFADSVDRDQLFKPPEQGDASLWVLALSDTQVTVTFSIAGTVPEGRHLVREVRLPNGLDDLGLERLAYVIHSAVVALGEGLQGTGRQEAEEQLALAGAPLSPRSPQIASSRAASQFGPTASPPPPQPTAPAHPRQTDATDAAARSRPRFPLQNSFWHTRQATLSAGYAASFRGPEGIGHGPVIELGLLLPRATNALSVVLSAHQQLRNTVEARALDAELRMSSMRVVVGWEHRLARHWTTALLAGGGCDLVHIHPLARPLAGSSENALSIETRSAGIQLRPALEARVGVAYTTDAVDLVLLPRVSFILNDAYYSIAGEPQRALTAQRLRPGVSLQMRIRALE